MEHVAQILVSYNLLSAVCADELLVKLSPSSVCIKLAVSKLLSLAIVSLSFMLKLPQIASLVRAKSAKGMSYAMFLSETYIFLVSACYGFRQGFPLSAYMENWVILAQVIAICVLLFHYARQSALIVVYLAAVAGAIAVFVVAPARIVELAFSLNIPILIYGRAPQIWANYRNKDTAALAFSTIALSFGGGLARIFTSLQEAPSPLILTGLVIGSLMNLVLMTQIVIYSKKGSSKKAVKKD